MSKLHVENVDLNLLRVFNAVMQTQHVTRASEQLYLSQSAVSHAITRLRHVLKDDLFIKVPGGVKPTARAVELWEPIQRALHILESALNPAVFDPLSSTRVFRVSCHDYFSLLVMPKLQHQLEAAAPNISLRFTHTEGRALAQLDEQRVDFAISAFGMLPERFDIMVLIEDDYVCLMDKRHPLVNAMSLGAFAASSHLLVSPKGDDKGFIDDLLAKQGMTRHVAIIVNHFSSAGEIIKHSNLVATLPKRVALRFQQQFDLHIEPCPLTAMDSYIQTKAVWHKHYTAGDEFEWFKQQLALACLP